MCFWFLCEDAVAQCLQDPWFLCFAQSQSKVEALGCQQENCFKLQMAAYVLQW